METVALEMVLDCPLLGTWEKKSLQSNFEKEILKIWRIKFLQRHCPIEIFVMLEIFYICFVLVNNLPYEFSFIAIKPLLFEKPQGPERPNLYPRERDVRKI